MLAEPDDIIIVSFFPAELVALARAFLRRTVNAALNTKLWEFSAACKLLKDHLVEVAL